MSDGLRYRASNEHTSSGASSNQFSDDLNRCRNESNFLQEQFTECVFKALRKEKLQAVNHHTRSTPVESKCFKTFKVLWILLLCFLAFCLLAAGFKPVTFHLHKVLHNRLYYILRPVRLAMVSILPVLDKVNLNFLDTDCMLENPLLSDVERCACFGIKYPKEVDLNFSVLPQHLTRAGIQDVYVLRNSTQFGSNFNIMNFVNFPSQAGGYPISCHEISGENIGLYRYDEFYQEEKMTRLLGRGDSWSFSWEECSDSNNPLTLHSIIPPLQPPLDLTSNATFSISTKWGTFTHFMESFPSGAVVIARVLLGEARFTMEPKKDECFGTCSMFRKNPVLRQGDALLFDQRVWNYVGTCWTDIVFVTVQLASLT